MEGFCDIMRVLINGTMSDGKPAPQDILNRAGWVIVDQNIARIENGEIIPVSEGTTELICNIGGIMTRTQLVISKVGD
jgi:hypothetical protein